MILVVYAHSHGKQDLVHPVFDRVKTKPRIHVIPAVGFEISLEPCPGVAMEQCEISGCIDVYHLWKLCQDACRNAQRTLNLLKLKRMPDL